MMKMYKSIFYFLFIVIISVSCGKEKLPTEPYFKFDAIGEQLLSGIKLNDTIKFAGTNGSNRQYLVFKIEKVKQTVQDCSWTLGTCNIYYHHDFEKFYFQRLDTIPPFPNSPLTATMTKQMQLPSGIDKKNIPKDVQVKTHFYGFLVDFNTFPQALPAGTTTFVTYPNFYTPLNYFTYSNTTRTFSEVVKLTSGNTSVFVDPTSGSRYTVNEVWFDKKFGVVFFKDVFANSWSRTN